MDAIHSKVLSSVQSCISYAEVADTAADAVNYELMQLWASGHSLSRFPPQVEVLSSCDKLSQFELLTRDLPLNLCTPNCDLK